MRQTLLLWSESAATRLAALAVAAVLAAGFSGCKNDSEAIPDSGKAYYPVAVNNFWTYAVTDTVWEQSSFTGVVVRGRVNVSNYQVRETITETFTDVAGKLAYRMVRASRPTATAAWTNDSVFVVSANDQFVAMSRSNRRTLEVVFPIKEGGKWHVNAFNNNNSGVEDTAKTRQYSHLGEAFTTRNAAGQPITAYPAAVATNDIGLAAEVNLLTQNSYQQVFAKNIGPVFRNRRRLAPYNYTDPSSGNQIFPTNAFSLGSYTHRETLIDYGPK